MNNRLLRLTLMVSFSALLLCTSNANEPKASTGDQQPSNREWSIVASYTIPGKASGLAWDGTYLYSGIYGVDGDKVYRIDPDDGSYILQFSNVNLEDAFGLTWDGINLWTIVQPSGSANPAIAQQMNLAGNFLDQITLPDHYMSGIAYDNGEFWVATYYPDPGNIYRVDDEGNLLATIPSPNTQPWDLCMENENLWVVDYYGNTIYKISEGGIIVESHPSENLKPSGIVYDGQYLWYVDGELGSQSTLYKVDLGGSGTPEINVPVTVHNYDNVTIGDSSTWDVFVHNIGTADLIIENIYVPAAAPVFSWFTVPATIPPGENIQIDLTYKPQEAIPLDAVVIIYSNDPVTPEVELELTGQGVYDGPYIHVPVTSHNYNEVRQNAYTRWFAEIQNMGDENLVINSITADDPHFFVDEMHQFPHSIQTLEVISFGIWFHPEEAISYASAITIECNDPAHNPFLVEVEGSGVDEDYPIGDQLWYYNINVSYDNSPKSIIPFPDITGDGVNEVIVGSEDDFFRCFNGNSSGVADVLWEREIYSGAVQGQNSMKTGNDVNNDGFPDLFAGTVWGDRSIYAFSGKNGEIIWKHDTHEYGDGGWVYQVDCSYDYNGDGTPDVLAATSKDANYNGPMRVYCLDAYNGSSIWECYTGGPVFSVMGIGDVTGDNVPDVIAGASDLYETQGKVYGIDGNDGSIKWTYNTAGTSVWALEQVDDINMNGKLDIVAGDFGGHIYFLDPEYGTYLDETSIGPYLILNFAEMDDVNDDGHPDILVGHSGTNGIMLDGMTGSNIWLHGLADKSWNVSRIFDISGDGINDAIIGTLYSSNYVYFLDGTDGSELESVFLSTPVDAISSIGDIVGDGSMEVVAGGRNGMVYCYSGGLNTGVGIYPHANNGPEASIKWSPNPFTSKTILEFEARTNGIISVEILNTSGTVVRSLANERIEEGNYKLEWDGHSDAGDKLPGGVYFYSIYLGEAHYGGMLVRQ